jgi:hypothetical protein
MSLKHAGMNKKIGSRLPVFPVQRPFLQNNEEKHEKKGRQPTPDMLG